MEKLLDVSDLANILKLKKPTIYKLISSRRIPFIKIGSRVFFKPDEIETWIKENSVKEVK